MYFINVKAMTIYLDLFILANNCFLKDVKYDGEVINACNDVTQSPEECQYLCQLMNGCTGFTWTNNEYYGSQEEQKQCCLKGDVILSHIVEKGIVSGPKYCFGIHMNIRIYETDFHITFTCNTYVIGYFRLKD